jgi:hypothetical protein
MLGRTRILFALAPRAFASPSGLEGAALSAPRADTPCADSAGTDGVRPRCRRRGTLQRAGFFHAPRGAAQRYQGRSPYLVGSMSPAKTLTIRLPSEVYERALQLAEARGQSLNRLFQDGFQLLDSQDEERRLCNDFSAIADAGSDEPDVAFAFTAQTETLRER